MTGGGAKGDMVIYFADSGVGVVPRSGGASQGIRKLLGRRKRQETFNEKIKT
tara:strand:- start:37 stop:192 length:156 start_codon:yes stop_codon:yes gene_type:complete